MLHLIPVGIRACIYRRPPRNVRWRGNLHEVDSVSLDRPRHTSTVSGDLSPGGHDCIADLHIGHLRLSEHQLRHAFVTARSQVGPNRLTISPTDPGGNSPTMEPAMPRPARWTQPAGERRRPPPDPETPQSSQASEEHTLALLEGAGLSAWPPRRCRYASASTTSMTAHKAAPGTWLSQPEREAVVTAITEEGLARKKLG